MRVPPMSTTQTAWTWTMYEDAAELCRAGYSYPTAESARRAARRFLKRVGLAAVRVRVAGK
jgi:hypothetical protein